MKRRFVTDRAGKRHGFHIDQNLVFWTTGEVGVIPPLWDTDAYSYSHGGELHQAAVRKAWAQLDFDNAVRLPPLSVPAPFAGPAFDAAAAKGTKL